MADVTDLFISVGLVIFLIIGILLTLLIKSLITSGTTKVGRRLSKRTKIGEDDDKLGFFGSLAIMGIIGILFIAFKEELVTIMPSTITTDSFLFLGFGFLVIPVILILLWMK